MTPLEAGDGAERLSSAVARIRAYEPSTLWIVWVVLVLYSLPLFATFVSLLKVDVKGGVEGRVRRRDRHQRIREQPPRANRCHSEAKGSNTPLGWLSVAAACVSWQPSLMITATKYPPTRLSGKRSGPAKRAAGNIRVSDFGIRDRLLLSLSTALLILALALPALPGIVEASDVRRGSSGPETCFAAPGGIVKAQDIILAMKAAGPELDCRGRTIQGDLNLFELPVRLGPSGKEEKLIARPLNFRDALFKGIVATWDQKTKPGDQPVRFAERFDARNARFQDAASFDGTVFEAAADFGDARFQKMASFTEATFAKPVTFRSARFDERALFTKTTFRDEADFAIATFNWIAFFPDSTFSHPSQEGANFLYTRFNDNAVFARAKFKGVAKFVATRFRGPTYFSDATFEDQVWFTGGARFDDSVTFRRAKFTRTDLMKPSGERQGPRAPVLFNGVVFSGDANFAETRFGHADFGRLEGLPTDIGIDTIFHRKADFRGATFESLGVWSVIFESEAQFSRADLGKRVEATDVDIAKASMHITWDQFLIDGKPKFLWQGVFKEGELQSGNRDARRALFDFLAVLERNFRERGQLLDAGEVHYLAEDLKRMDKGLGDRVLDTIFSKGVYGYGVRPSHQIWLAFFLIVGFGFAYVRRDALRYEPAERRAFRLRITDIPVNWSGGTEDSRDPSLRTSDPGSAIWRYVRGLTFSWYVFSKIGFGGVVASRTYAVVVVAEWVLGAAVWIVFLVNLANRWPLLHRLVTMAVP